MMKYVSALVVLLHLCYGSGTRGDLTKEIGDRLKTLNELFGQNKLNISSRDTMLVPSSGMQTRASSCVGVFVKELKQLLKNVTVSENDGNILDELEANLELMEQPTENKVPCIMRTINQASLMPFQQYLRFLNKLHRNKKR